MRAVALLRGVNVGGVRFAMRDFVTALEERGYRDVRTVLASGNVVLTPPEGRDDPVGADVAAVVRDRFGFEVGVIAVDGDVARAAAAAYPFQRDAGRHAYVVFADPPPVLAEVVHSAGPLDPAVERVAAGGRVLYWDVPKGATLTSPFGVQLGRRQRSGVVTTRNLNTLEKIVAVL